jgi:hypothetical protein
VDQLSPGLVRAHRYLDRLSGVPVPTAPLEDLRWYGYTAAFLGAYSEYWHGVAVAAPRARTHPTGTGHPGRPRQRAGLTGPRRR